MPKITLNSPEKIKKIYFVGIKGVGMTSLAIIAKEAGFSVCGSDIEEEFLTDEILNKNGISVDSGFESEKLRFFLGSDSSNTALVITTAAHGGLSNPQCSFAKKLGVQVLTHGQAVGYFMEGLLFKRSFEGVSILGCHGKTTVTAMCATAFERAGLDPSYAVGTSELFPLGNPGHLGKGVQFIAEADEFISDIEVDRTVKFLFQYPRFAIINNIDFDHPDVYKDLDDVYNVFLKFAKENVVENGTLIINGDDEKTLELKREVEALRKDLKIITYGELSSNIVRLKNLKENAWGSEFEVFTQGASLGAVTLNVPGFHNAKNSLAVVALLHALGQNPEKISRVLSVFTGSKRRQEKIGETKNGALIIDDYAHHPDEIIKTIRAVKSAYPDKKIISIFQPHTVGRTIALKDAFADSLKDSFKVLFLPVFSSKREGNVDYSRVYSQIESELLKKGTNAVFFEDHRTASESEFSPYFLKKYRSFVVKYVVSEFDSDQYVIVTLGAGDVYKIAYDLADRY